MGGQSYKENFHCNGWDFESLKTDLEEVGFINIKRCSPQDMPSRHDTSRLDISLNISAIKPQK